MGKCLVITLPGEVTDNSLRKLGEVIFDITPRGDGSGFTEVKIQVDSSTLPLPIISVSNGGKVYRTIDSDPLNELELVWTGNSNNKIYVKTNGIQPCKLHMQNAINIKRLGFGFDTEVFSRPLSSNSPLISIPLDESLYTLGNLTTIYHTNNKGFSGDISCLSYLPKLAYFMADWTAIEGDITTIKSNMTQFTVRGSFLTGDLRKFFDNNPKATTVQIATYGTPIPYKGDASKLSNATIVNISIAENTQQNTEGNRQLGNFIRALSQCTFRDTSLGGASVTLKGDKATLNAEELTALGTLQAKATVTINTI